MARSRSAGDMLGCKRWSRPPACDCTTTFSRTLSPARSRLIWNVRAIPFLVIRWGGRPSIRWPSNSNGAGIGLVQTGDHVEHGRLASAIGADQGGDRAFLDREGAVLDGTDAAEGLAQILDFEEGQWRTCRWSPHEGPGKARPHGRRD